MAITTNMDVIKRIHFIGIGGVGMGAVAEVLLIQGYQISGSDIVENAVTKHLQSLGAKITCGHRSENIHGAELVVYSSAIPMNNPEIIMAQQMHIPLMGRGQILGELMRRYYGIAVAGTHGKTTTTSLITTILTEGNLDPTFVIGGLLRSIGTHARVGHSQYFVAEADESDASFLYLYPKIAVITNIDSDHLNNYRNFEHLKATFMEFLQRLPKDGLAIVCRDDPVVRELLPQISGPYLTYGFNEKDNFRIIEYQQQGIRCQMKVQRHNKTLLNVTLNLPGRHNVLNALAAIAVATQCNVTDEAINRALEKFQGTGRRFQIYGEFDIGQGQVILIDDYGHHPREIAVTLEAARKAWPARRLVLAFQPHRYSRTQAIFQDFVDVLSQVDVLLLLDIYPAGEVPIPGINSQVLCDAVQKTGKINPIFVPKLQQLPILLNQVLRHGDVLLLQGAGDIGKMAPQLARAGLRIDY